MGNALVLLTSSIGMKSYMRIVVIMNITIVHMFKIAPSFA